MKRALPLVTMLLSVWMAGTSVANATEYPLPPPDSRLIGENTTFTVQNNGKPLEDVAARFQIGLLGMLEANPGVDPYLPKPGTVLTIPTQMLLPDAPREGLLTQRGRQRRISANITKPRASRCLRWSLRALKTQWGCSPCVYPHRVGFI